MSSPARDEMMVRYLEGIASAAEVAALESALQADRGMRREFVRLAHLQALFVDLPPTTATAPEVGTRRPGLALAGALAAALAVALLWNLHQPDGADAATVSALSGAASAIHAGSGRALARGDRLRAGDHLTLAGQAELTLSWRDGTVVIIAGGSEVALGGGEGAALTLAQGMLHATVVHDPRRPFSIATPQALARDIGTEFTVRADANGTVVRVEGGEVALTNGLGTVSIPAGASARAAPGRAPLLDAPAAAAPEQPPLPPVQAPPAAVPATLTVSGTVTAVDGARHSFTLMDGLTGTANEYRAYFAGGHAEAILQRIAALTVGEALMVTYVEKEGRRALAIAPAPAPIGPGRGPRP